MPEEPMTAEEVAAAREWIGLSDEQASDSDVIESLKDSLWLARYRFNQALRKLVSEVMAAAVDELEGMRIEIRRKQ